MTYRLTIIVAFLWVFVSAGGVVRAESVDSETSPQSASNPVGALAPFAGIWRRVSDPNAESARVTSIDTATAELTWVVRKMAAGVLKKSTLPPDQVRFSWDGDGLTQIVRGPDGDHNRPVRLDGQSAERLGPRGKPFTSQWKWTADGLEVHWIEEQAFGSHVYRIDESDQSLIVEQRIQVTAISDVAPISFRSRFDRIIPPSVSSAPTQTVSGSLR